jgi:predicted RNA-binding protein with RPS1 domain
MDAEEAAGARVRIQLDWRTFVYLVAAVVGALAVLAVFSGTATMLTRIGVGLIIALALDPLTNAIRRRLRVGRGLAAGIVGLAVLGLTAVFIGVLAPLAVEEAGQFSEQLPATLDELEQLPVVGGLLRDNELADRVQEWVRDLPEQFTDERFGAITVKDIFAELEKPGRDPRPDFKVARFNDGIKNISDLKQGMLLEGTVSNVAQFGAFVDLGVHQDGLIHVSQLADKFVSDAREVVKTGDIVKVKVLEVDLARQRISLTMKLDAKPVPAGERNGYRAPARGERVAAPNRAAAPAAGGSAMADAFARLQKR